MRLNGEVKRCGRIIRDKDIRIVGKRNGNNEELEMKKGKIIRVDVDEKLRLGNEEKFKELKNEREGIIIDEEEMIEKRIGKLIENKV